jgi:hypothetical protein
MRLCCTILTLALAAGCLACGSDSSSGGDEGDSRWDDIKAGDIIDYEVRDRSYCVGQRVLEAFADYDYQCEGTEKLGECVYMANPHLGNPFYCALCGLKGTKTICYMINQE